MNDTTALRPGWADGLSPLPQWAILLALSACLSAFLLWAGLPAALLLGPTVAGVMLTAGGARLQLGSLPFSMAQALIGCMIVGMLSHWTGGGMGAHWFLFVAGVISVIVISGALGLLMTRLRVLPGTTALWGLSPGAASAMVVMAEAYGADAKVVAFMQYLRVLLVAGAASLVAKLMGVGVPHAAAHAAWFAPIAWLPFCETLGLALASVALSHRLNLRTGPLLIPLVAGVVLSHQGLMTIELPRWLLALTYATVGWRIGLGFTRELLLYCARLFPRLLVCSLVLIALCGGLALLLVFFAGIDPLTAYLAMSPGGADTAAIIAASSNVDLSFVMTMQIARFMTILILGPMVVKTLARLVSEDRPGK